MDRTQSGRTAGRARTAQFVRLLFACAAAVALSGGCRHLSEQDRQIASAYQENAAQYYDSGHYLRAFQQWEKVLELEPDNEKARLGQAMSLYQLGLEESADGVARLALAEERIEGLRDGSLGDREWKADLGYALVQVRWAVLYQRKIDRFESEQRAGRPVPEDELATCRREFPRRVRLAEETFRIVLDDERTEPNFHLTCWLGLARAAALRGDWESTIQWARQYERKVTESREFWSKQGQEYASRLLGVELQEVELRDAMANCLFKLGRYAEAEAELDRVLEIQPDRADAHLNRAQVRRLRSAWDPARADLNEFLARTALPKDHPTVLEARKLLVEVEDRLAEEDERMRLR